MDAAPRLSPEIRRAMEGVLPAIVATCSADGEPNATVISQVYYVDDDHVALSHQFFNKTYRNVRENPQLFCVVTCPDSMRFWSLRLRYDHSETEGPVFDAMDMQIEAIASLTGMSGIFKLKAADIYEVVAVQQLGGS
ncbi:pyridoxamine 5'-phosphate oxidase family protein [Marinibaculum pumilum]|uniref:Pyridoxamine 5'-phosphate oxidase family protein n=1 Tax=Marinibaculum pumilum TaxID=1766165 RepID=A0ABV7L0Q8_9PROT